MIAVAVWSGAWFKGRDDSGKSFGLDTAHDDRPSPGQSFNPLLKLALDLGPLLLFFYANAKPALFEPWLAPLIPEAVRTGERSGIFVGDRRVHGRDPRQRW